MKYTSTSACSVLVLVVTAASCHVPGHSISFFFVLSSLLWFCLKDRIPSPRYDYEKYANVPYHVMYYIRLAILHIRVYFWESLLVQGLLANRLLQYWAISPLSAGRCFGAVASNMCRCQIQCQTNNWELSMGQNKQPDKKKKQKNA